MKIHELRLKWTNTRLFYATAHSWGLEVVRTEVVDSIDKAKISITDILDKGICNTVIESYNVPFNK